MEARENKFQISQNEILHMKFYLCFLNSCETFLKKLFFQAPITIISRALEKCNRH